MLVKEKSFLPLRTVMLLSLSAVSQAASQGGNGEVTMRGAILETACTIATRDAQQSINMGSLPISSLMRDGKGPASPLTIRLTGCMPGASNSAAFSNTLFSITFEGSAEGPTFNLQGEASGVALRISDAAGHIAKAGIALPPQSIKLGDMRLEYFLTLISNQNTLLAGTYFTTVRFKLDYF
ncbi:type 1 fimbrial protein [Erwinia aphidicola]|nr:type 1 fimbrial protein [Erwinia aphidicola]